MASKLDVLSLCIRLAVAFLVLFSAAVPAHAQGVYSVRGPWVDDQSRPFDLASLANSYTVVTMAYGACHRVCSVSLRTVETLAALAAQRRMPLHIVVVGLDPTEDKPSDWAALRAEHKLSFENVDFLTGTDASVRQLASRIGLKYWRYGEHTLHDYRIVLIGPSGQVVRSLDRYDADASTLLP